MADANKIVLEIVTPRGMALSASVDEVTAPSITGEFGVLPGHLPVLAALKSGIVTYRQGTESRRCAVGNGFAEVGANKLSILTDEFAEREGIDPVVLRKELAEIDAQVTALFADAATEATAAEKQRVLVVRQNWIATQLELYGDPPPATMRPSEEFGPPAPPPEDEVPQDTDRAKGA